MAELINEVLDVKAINEQIAEVKKSFNSLNGELLSLLEGAVKLNEEMRKNNSFGVLIKLVHDSNKAFDEASVKMREIQRLQEEKIKLETRLKAAMEDEARVNALLRVQNAEKNRELKQEAELMLAKQKASGGYIGAVKQEAKSIAELRDQNKQLRIIRDQLNTETDVEKIQQLNSIIDNNTNVIRLNQDAISQQKMNIGNYKSALDGMKQTLADASKAMQDLAAKGDTTSKEYQDLQKTISDTTIKIDAFTKEMLDAAKDAEPMKAQLNELKREAQQLYEAMKTGNATNEMKQRFRDVTEEAAKLQANIDAVGDRIKHLASSSSNFEATLQGIQTVNAGMQAWYGTMGLLGKENEKFKLIIQKVASAQAVANSLLTISNALKKQSAMMTALQAATESKYIVVRGAATASQWLLNAAMYACPYIALAAGLAVLGKMCYDFATSNSKAAMEQKLLNEIMEKSTEIIKKEAGELENLFQTAIVYSEGTAKRADAIKNINEKYGIYLPNLLSEKSTLEDITRAHEMLLPVMEKLAMMEALKNMQIEKSGELVAMQIKHEESRAQIEERLTFLQDNRLKLMANGVDAMMEEAVLKKLLNEIDEKEANAKDELEKITKKYTDAMQEEIALRKQTEDAIKSQLEAQQKQVDMLKMLDDYNKTAVEKEQEHYKEQLKLLSGYIEEERKKIIAHYAEQRKLAKGNAEELYQIKQQEREALLGLTDDYNSKEAIVTKIHQQNLTKIHEPEVKKRQGLLKKQYDFELKAIEERTKLEIALEQDKFNQQHLQLTTEYEKRKKEIQAQLDDDKKEKDETKKMTIAARKALDDQLKLLAEKYNMDIDKLHADELKDWKDKEEKRIEKIIEYTKRNQEARIKAAEMETSTQLVDLSDQYAKGLISHEEYEKEKVRITREAQQNIAQSEIDLLYQLLDDSRIQGQARLDIEKKIAEMEVELCKKTNDEIISDNEKSAKKQIDIEKAKWDKIKELSKQAIGLIFEAVKTASDNNIIALDAQMAKIDELMEKNNERKEQELADLDEKAMSEERYAMEKEAIEQRAMEQEKQLQAQRDAIEEKKKQEKIKQAKWEKAQAVVQIGIETAKAIIAATASGAQGGLAAPAFIAAYVGIVAALGAAQMALVIAKKIPEYRYGTPDHPGGYAVTGDAGKHEYVQTPSGRIYETPAVATVMDIPRHSVVFPDWNALMAERVRGVATSASDTSDNAEYARALQVDFDKMGKKIVRAVEKNKASMQVNIDENGLTRITKKGSAHYTYINRMTKFI